MTIIDELLAQKSAQEAALGDETRLEPRSRYCYETTILGHLARYALNKPKNIGKEAFEKLTKTYLMILLEQEIVELEEELFFWTEDGYRNSKMYDPEKALEELADCAATLTGILVKIMKEIKEDD